MTSLSPQLARLFPFTSYVSKVEVTSFGVSLLAKFTLKMWAIAPIPTESLPADASAIFVFNWLSCASVRSPWLLPSFKNLVNSTLLSTSAVE